MSKPVTLITIPFSHYNLFARTILNKAKIPYKETRFLPLLHMLPVYLEAGGGRKDATSTPFSTPVIVIEKGKSVSGTREILEWARNNSSEDLGELDEEWAQRAHDVIGKHARRVAYSIAFADLEETAKGMGEMLPSWQRAILPVYLPILKDLLTRALNLSPKGVSRAMGLMRDEVEALSKAVEEKGRLGGETDLYVACLLSVALLPSREDGFPCDLSSRSKADPSYVAAVEEFRRSKGGQHVLQVLRDASKIPSTCIGKNETVMDDILPVSILAGATTGIFLVFFLALYGIYWTISKL